MTTTFAAAFATALEKLGVRHAFGVSGGAISYFWSALGGTGIDVTHFRHESGAAFAACEASIATDAPVVVFVTTGPGLTNVLTGMYAARHEAARVILVSAVTESAMIGRRPIQETGPRTLPQEGIYTAGPLFDYATGVTAATQLPEMLDALAEGVSRSQGFTAHVSLTLGVQRSEVSPCSPAPAARTVPSVEEAAAETSALLRDQSWVLWVGGGARRSAGAVRRLVRAAGVPVMATPRGKGVVDEGDPAYLGVTGFAGHESVLEHLDRHRPEYTLVLGSTLGDFGSGYHPGYLPGSAFVQVDLDPTVHGRAYPLAKTIPVLADVGAFVGAMATRYEAGRAPSVGVRPFAGDTPPGAVRPFAGDTPSGGPLVDPAHLMAAVQDVFVHSGVTVLAETGNALAWAINRLRVSDPAGWRAPSGLVGSMGHFSAGVVGAALASPRRFAALVGDGSMLMLNEVSTAVHKGAPAIWVVLNDSVYNMCAQGAGVLGLTDVDCSMPATDFAMLATALGATGITVRHPDELTGALAAALRTAGPVVVDVHVDPSVGAPTKGRNAGLLRDSTRHPPS